MNIELQRIWKDVVVAESWHCSIIYVKRLRKVTRNLRIADVCRDSNPSPPDHDYIDLPLPARL
jgi:hypothetical protein